MDEDKQDFKTTDTIDVAGGETGQSQKAEEPIEEEVEAPKKKEKKADPDVEELRAKLEKTESDKENYKKGLLSSKKKLKSLDVAKEKPEEKEEEESEWDEESSKFQKETLKKSEEIAKKAIAEANSKTAIQQFVAKYPEADKSSTWQDIAAAYADRRGKDSVENIVLDIEDAYLIVKRDRGELASVEDVLRGEQEGILKAQTSNLGAVASQGGEKEKSTKGSGISKGAMDMAKAFRQDPEKVSKETEETTATIEI